VAVPVVQTVVVEAGTAGRTTIEGEADAPLARSGSEQLIILIADSNEHPLDTDTRAASRGIVCCHMPPVTVPGPTFVTVTS
jgi:hypothetical protein